MAIAVPSLVRQVGFGVIAVAGVAVWIVMTPRFSTDTVSLPSAVQYETLISSALDDNEANDARTESAPQQQVVNGWVARDLLTIIAKENADVLRASGAIVQSNGVLSTNPFDNRVPALLLLGVIALSWHGFTVPVLIVRATSAPGLAVELPTGTPADPA